MEEYKNIFNSICRLCLKSATSSTMESLYDSKKELSVLGEIVNSFTDKFTFKEDYLPLNICQNCKKMLEDFNSFKNMCVNNQQQIENFITNCLEKRICKEDIIKSFCEYILYCEYFPEDNCIKADKTIAKLEKSKQKEVIEKSKQKEVSSNIKTSLNNLDDNFNTDNKNTTSYIDSLFKTMEQRYTYQEKNEKNGKKTSLREKRIITKENITCKTCNKTLANRKTYDNHMQRHGDNLPKYICDKCAKSFPVLYELKRHQILVHNKTSIHKCDQCPFVGDVKLKLIEHKRLHTGERPFTCEKCGLTFRRKTLYNLHLRKHGEKTIQCNMCPKMFHCKNGMLGHKNSVHERIYLYLCRICQAAYAKITTVRKHMLIKHGIAREEQGKVLRVNKNTNAALFNEKISTLIRGK